MNNKDFTAEFIRIWEHINARKPMAYGRYADGEVALMQGRKVDQASQAFQVDRWSSMSDKMTLLGKDLKETLYHTESGYFYAISCKCCDPKGQAWLLNEIKQPSDNITYSNLWINDNYKRFMNQMGQLKEPIYLICNERGGEGMYPFDVFGFYPVKDDCVCYWDANKSQIITDMQAAALSANGGLYLISAGPLSEVLIHHLWIANPTNRYIDVGSAIDEFVHGRKTRPFMVEGTQYFSKKCEF